MDLRGPTSKRRGGEGRGKGEEGRGKELDEGKGRGGEETETPMIY